MQPTKDQMLWMFEQMLVIREFEETDGENGYCNESKGTISIGK